MNIAEAKEQIKDAVDAYLSQDETGAYELPPAAQRPLFLLGAPGVGKTAIVGQVTDELGIGLVSYSMTHHTRQSALGLPFIVEHTYRTGETFSVSEYTMSEIIASMWDYMEESGFDKGILFLDEINCVSETLYPSMLQFLQFKTFGRHRVPDGWVVVCAGNPPEYNKSVYDFDVVTLDRLRKVEVEPDLDAWMSYAHAQGVHPAIITYLDVRRDQFYSVESTPSGKAFVTARSWDDLSRTMTLYEKTGKPVGRALIGQYLQDVEIAEQFAQYYELFDKYRSDYPVGDILDGNASDEAIDRAREARFDERLAVVRLLIDGLDARLAGVLEEGRVTAIVRDVLRRVKPVLLADAGTAAALEPEIDALADEASRRVGQDAARAASVRPERLAATRLRSYIGSCDQQRLAGGAEAFAYIEKAYASDVEAFRLSVERASASMDRAFGFVEAAFGDGREADVFTAELAMQRNTSQFISRFGNDAYQARSANMPTHGSREALMARIDALGLPADDGVEP